MDFPETCYLKILEGVSGSGYLLSCTDSFNHCPIYLSATDDDSGRQRWKLVPVEGGASDTFNIIAQDALTRRGMWPNLTYLEWNGDGVSLAQFDDGTGRHSWQFTATDEGTYLIKPAPLKKSTTLPFLSCSADGTRVDMYSEDDRSGRQRWYVAPDSGRMPPASPRFTAENIPAEIKAAFVATIPPADFQARLKQGGTLRLRAKDLDLGISDPDKGDQIFMALDVLELHYANIITGGKSLVMFVNRIESHRGSIVSYTDSQRKAARGADGGGSGQAGHPGAPGAGGGSVSIYVIEQLSGLLNVDLGGQEGGDGGNGSEGAAGPQGDQGGYNYDDAKDLMVPEDGKKGGTGLKGANGGNGGSGGAGGNFELVNVGREPIPDEKLSFSAAGGRPGLGGQGGAGGQGGPGGPGGRGWHDGGQPDGNPGPRGDAGVSGTAGPDGTPGPNGRAARNNRDLEAVIRVAAGYVKSSLTVSE